LSFAPNQTNNLYRLLLFWSAITMAYTNLQAQQPTDSCTLVLAGQVRDAATGEALPFAEVLVVDLGTGTAADGEGHYILQNLCAGTYHIHIMQLGYETADTNITLRTSMGFSVSLTPTSIKVGTVVVDGERRHHEATTQSVTTIEAQQLEETRGLSLGEGLTKVSGLSIISTGPSISKPVIHGLHSNRILILNNGIRQEGQQWGSEHAPEIDAFMAKRLTVIKGASSVRYGSDAIGGVILVEPDPLRRTPGIGGELNLVGFSNGLRGVMSGILEGNFRKAPSLSWRLQGTIKRSGNMRTPDYYLANSAYQERNFSGAVGYLKPKFGVELFYSEFRSKIGILSASHIGNLTDLNLAFQSDVPLITSGFDYTIGRPYQFVRHDLFKFKTYINTGSLGKLTLLYGYQYNLRYEYDKDPPLNDSLAALNLPELQYEITTHSLNLDWEHTQVGSFKGMVGVSFMNQANLYSGRFFIPNFRNFGGGVYALERFIKPKFELEAGIRYDYKWQQAFIPVRNNTVLNPTRTFGNVSGSLGAIIKPNKVWDLHLNIGTAWRPPAINELYSNGLHHGAAAIEIGDSTLAPEHAYNASATLNVQTLGDKLHIELGAYYTYFNNYIYARPELPPMLTIRGAFPTFRYTQVNADFKGIDLNLEYNVWKGLSLGSKSSLLWAWNYTDDDYLINIPSQRFEHSISYKFNDYKRISNAYVTVTGKNVLQQKRAPLNADFAPPPPAYFLLGLNVGFTVMCGKQPLEFGLAVNNLLNQRYREYLDRFRYFVDAPGTDVSVRVRVPFNFKIKP
jgi:iron complex outermembrane receptor protein